MRNLRLSIDVFKTIMNIVRKYELDIEDYFHMENVILEAPKGAAILELCKIDEKLAKASSFEVSN